MPSWIWRVVAAIVAVAALSRSREPDLRRTLPPRQEPGDTFIYDTAARFNERLAANIDAIDTSLTAVMAGDIAILVFAVDKLAEFYPLRVWWAIAFLTASILVCAFGYVAGLPRANEGDGLRPGRLVADLVAKPNQAMIDAIADMVLASEVNHSVRLLKRVAVVLAIVLLATGAVIVALARLGGSVVR